jgi:membrane-bound ClpP family serine protease
VLLEITLPINGNSAQVLQKTLEHLDLSSVKNNEYVVLQFNVPDGEELNAQDSSFGSCYELAELLTGERFRSVKTAAFASNTLSGHCLLPFFACQERIMSADAELVPPPSVNKTERQAYLDIARQRNIPAAVIEKMFDTKVPLRQIETPDGIKLTTEIKADEDAAVKPVDLIAAGQNGVISANLARQLGIVHLIADSVMDTARGLGIQPDSLKTVPLRSGNNRSIRVDINGVMTEPKVASLIRRIRLYINENELDFLCVVIDSPGGSIDASLQLASFFAGEIDRTKIKTAAYVPHQARSDAALVAAACDETVLGYGAVLGGDGAREFTPAQIAEAVKQIKLSIAPGVLRSWSVPAAFIDPNIELRKTVRTAKNGLAVPAEYLCADEFDAFADKADWQSGDIVKAKGQLLEIKITNAGTVTPMPFGIVDRTAKDFDEFKLFFHLEKDPAFVQPTWAEKIVQILSAPEMSVILLLLAWLGIIIEGKMPGIGIGAFVAVVCLALFFWSAYLGGTAGYLEILLFLIGTGCLLFEIFVLPGFGIFGIGGIVILLASFILASQTFVIPHNAYQFSQLQHTLLILFSGSCGLLALGYYLSRTLDKYTKQTDGSLIEEAEKLADYGYLFGEQGLTSTPLVPAGKVVIGSREYDVVSEGMLIDKGEPVEVIGITGYKITVRCLPVDKEIYS